MTDWGEYGDYGGCSRTCGGGTKTRTRPCLPSGSGCVGSTTDVVSCNTQECPCKSLIVTHTCLHVCKSLIVTHICLCVVNPDCKTGLSI